MAHPGFTPTKHKLWQWYLPRVDDIVDGVLSKTFKKAILKGASETIDADIRKNTTVDLRDRGGFGKKFDPVIAVSSPLMSAYVSLEDLVDECVAINQHNPRALQLWGDKFHFCMEIFHAAERLVKIRIEDNEKIRKHAAEHVPEAATVAEMFMSIEDTRE